VPPERPAGWPLNFRPVSVFASINPANGEVLGYVNVSGPDEVNARGARCATRAAAVAALHGAERARVLRRAAQLLRARNQQLAELETRDTGKPIQERRWWWM